MAKRKHQEKNNADSNDLFKWVHVLQLYYNPELKSEIEENLKKEDKKSHWTIGEMAYQAWKMRQLENNPAYFGTPSETEFPYIAQKPCWN